MVVSIMPLKCSAWPFFVVVVDRLSNPSGTIAVVVAVVAVVVWNPNETDRRIRMTMMMTMTMAI